MAPRSFAPGRRPRVVNLPAPHLFPAVHPPSAAGLIDPDRELAPYAGGGRVCGGEPGALHPAARPSSTLRPHCPRGRAHRGGMRWLGQREWRCWTPPLADRPCPFLARDSAAAGRLLCSPLLWSDVGQHRTAGAVLQHEGAAPPGRVTQHTHGPTTAPAGTPGAAKPVPAAGPAYSSLPLPFPLSLPTVHLRARRPGVGGGEVGVRGQRAWFRPGGRLEYCRDHDGGTHLTSSWHSARWARW